MKFVDQVKVHLRSGRGGNGCASFRREKYIPRGGPDGGDGGAGGTIYFRGDRGKSTLLDMQFRQHIHAQNGGAGMGKDRHGKNGEDMVVDLPLGTVARDAETRDILLEVLDERELLALPGGEGGRGNARFKSSTNRAPLHAEEGRPGVEKWVELELKLMADVGLVGFPNAGKSTLIARVSRARPKIADYPFTTLVPNLGVVPGERFESFVIADIPGIIAGAHEGAGLGLRFLRHIERTAVLLLLVDGSGAGEREPYVEYEILLAELGAFSARLLDKPRAVALTKFDAWDAESRSQGDEEGDLARRLTAAGERVFPISAVSGEGVEELMRFLAGEVAALRAGEPSPDERSGASTPRKTVPPPPPSPAGCE